MPSAPQADVAEIRRTLDLMAPAVFEIRILASRCTVSGYFDADHHAQAAADAAKYAGRAGVYFTPNTVRPALLARSANHLIEYARTTTTDADIDRRQYLLIDLDSVRPAGVSSSDDEHAAALTRAQDIIAHLRAAGWPEPFVVADSGNGAHLVYKIDLPNDDESRDLVKAILAALDARFSDDVVLIDKTTYNAARIWKLYGTVACKGDSTADRPHRMARIQ